LERVLPSSDPAEEMDAMPTNEVTSIEIGDTSAVDFSVGPEVL
jgi:hypothetical protein